MTPLIPNLSMGTEDVMLRTNILPVSNPPYALTHKRAEMIVLPIPVNTFIELTIYRPFSIRLHFRNSYCSRSIHSDLLIPSLLRSESIYLLCRLNLIWDELFAGTRSFRVKMAWKMNTYRQMYQAIILYIVISTDIFKVKQTLVVSKRCLIPILVKIVAPLLCACHAHNM